MPDRLVRAFAVVLLALTALAGRAPAQVIEYETSGRKYQTVTRKGLTVIVTRMTAQVAGFALIQVSIANGSDVSWNVQPEGFSYVKQAGTQTGISANQVVDLLLEHGSASDVVKLVTSYENNLYGIPKMRSTNGFEQRRQNAMVEGVSPKLKAAAMASAIAFSFARIAPGQSTDGAVFIPTGRDSKVLAGGRIVFRAGSEVFEFNPD